MNVIKKPNGIVTILFIILFLSSFIIGQTVKDGKDTIEIMNGHDYSETYFHTYPGQNIFTSPGISTNMEWNSHPNLPDGLRLYQNNWEINGKKIDSYGDHSCAISSTSNVLCWILKDDGNIDSELIDIGNNSGVVDSLAVGSSHSCAIYKTKSENSVHCWGLNRNGQLGLPNVQLNQSELKIEGLWQNISVGSVHTCGYSNYREIYCWGGGLMGQIGNGGSSNVYLPSIVNISGIENIQKIESGSFHNCAIINGGEIYCWGWNAYGQLGDGSHENKINPVRVTFPEGQMAKSISLGESHTCALLKSEEIYCWGKNNHNQINDLENNRYNSPQKISLKQNNGIKDIFIGSKHTCIMYANDTYSCIGEITSTNMYIQGGYSDLVAGSGFNCFVKNNGFIFCDGIMNFDNMYDVSLQILTNRVPIVIFPGTIAGEVPYVGHSNFSITSDNGNVKSNIKVSSNFSDFVDDDGDGWGNDLEILCESDLSNSTSTPKDTDNNGICNPMDEDDDGDGVMDINDDFPENSKEWRDEDRDGIGSNAEIIEFNSISIAAIITNFILFSLLILEIIKKYEKIW